MNKILLHHKSLNMLINNEVKLDVDFYFNIFKFFIREENWLSNKSYFMINH